MTAPGIGPGSSELATLAQITADLDGYIERRARELAAPLVAEAIDTAAGRVQEIQTELQRQTDLVKELQRQMKPLLRQSEQRGRAQKVVGQWASRQLEPQASELLRAVSTALNARTEVDKW